MAIVTGNTEFVVNTGLKGRLNKSILDNVIGQMSDGKWENSRVMEHYWPFVNIVIDGDENVLILIQTPNSKKCCMRENSYSNNWWCHFAKLNKNHEAIRKFFAKRLHEIVTDERKTYPNQGIKFNDKCMVKSNYMWDSDSREDHIISDIYKAYKVLKG